MDEDVAGEMRDRFSPRGRRVPSTTTEGVTVKPWVVLGIPENASEQLVKKGFQRLCKQCDPNEMEEFTSMEEVQKRDAEFQLAKRCADRMFDGDKRDVVLVVE